MQVTEFVLCVFKDVWRNLMAIRKYSSRRVLSLWRNLQHTLNLLAVIDLRVLFLPFWVNNFKIMEDKYRNVNSQTTYFVHLIIFSSFSFHFSCHLLEVILY